MENKKTKRVPIVNGLFYPDNSDELEAIVKKYLENINRKDLLDIVTEQVSGGVDPERPVAIIAPHAGYMFSGKIQAYSYRLVMGNTYDTIVIIGSAHQKEFEGISVNTDGEYEIPLGSVQVDTDFARYLISISDDISTIEDAHLQEHSIEVQLPFIKYLFPSVSIVPILFGDQYLSTSEILYNSLVKAMEKFSNKKILFIITSDLSHYHNYVDAKNLDETLIADLKKMDPKSLYKDIKDGKCEACCYAGLITGIMLAKNLGKGEAAIIRYMDSGEVTGDRRRVVGYLSAALY